MTTKTPLSLDEFDVEAAWAEAHAFFGPNYDELADDALIEGMRNNKYNYVAGMRKQHSKDKAVIQELREHISELHKLRKNERTEIQTLKAENERLRNPKLKIGQYEIREFHNGNYWIEHESGEAMETAKDKLEACITQFYSDNF